MAGKHVEKEVVIVQKLHGFIENKSYQRIIISHLNEFYRVIDKNATDIVFHFSRTLRGLLGDEAFRSLDLE
jgi:CDP-glycerol glycerophosphotransferase (TagB/SpsB family)